MRVKIINLFTIIFVMATYLSGKFDYNIITNADSIYAFSLFKSILTGNSNIFDWYPSPSPYVFPDLLLYLFSFILGFGNVFYIPLIYIILQLALFYISIKYMLNRLLPSIKSSELASLAVLLATLMSYYYGTYSIMLTPLFHFGVLISCLVSVGLLYGANDKKSNKCIILYILAFISSYSDNMYVIWFSLPTIGIAITILIFKRDGAYLRPSIFCFIASLLGMYSTKHLFINSNMYGYSFNASIITKNLNDAAIIFAGTWHGQLLIISLCASVIYSINRIIKKNYDNNLITSLYYIYSFLSALFILSSQDSLPQADRYYAISFFLMIIISSWIVMLFVKFKYITFISPLIMISIFISLGYVSFIDGDRQCVIQHIKAAKLQNGISGYWDSKKLMAYDGDLSIAQVDQNMNAYRWITSERLYNNPAYFAIVDNNNGQSIRYDILTYLNGKPFNAVECGRYQVLFYKTPIKINSLKNVGDTSIFDGKFLSYANHITKDGFIYPSYDFSGGNFSFGPSVNIYIGTYEYSVKIINEKNETVKGYVDVVNRNGKNVISKNNFSSDKDIIYVNGKFEIDPDNSKSHLAIRLFLNERYNIRIDNIKIKKIN